jgi:hypothetical protein
MKEIEKLLGRKLTTEEETIYETYKDDLNYAFYKDKNGNLIASRD